MRAEANLSYVSPTSLAAALAAIAVPGGRIIAGGTDLYPAHVGRLLQGRLIDVSSVVEMRKIEVTSKTVRFGGAVTWTEIAQARLPLAFAALQEAALQVGSPQVQNRGTIGGNLCNASPAADGIPPLLILDAEVELASTAGLRQLPLSDFLTGYRQTALGRQEVLTAVIVPVPPPGTSSFVKLGARKYLVISIVMVAALVQKTTEGRIAQARIAVGSASEKALRLRGLEHDLIGLAAGDVRSAVIRQVHLEGLKPIGDVRATAAYRLDAARHLISDAIGKAAGV